MVTTRSLGSQSVSNKPSMPKSTAFAFAAGEFGANLSWNMVSGFILFYYSNVAKLPVAAVGTLLLVCRILDAAIDPAIGIAVDKTRSRFGRARPWLLYASVPFAVMTVLTFNVPDWSESAKLIYAYITFTVVGLLYSAIYVPYNAMAPLMTSVPSEKLRLGTFRSMAASAGSIVIYGSLMKLVEWFGGGNAQTGFTWASGIMAIGTVIGMLIVFQTCRERSHEGREVSTELLGSGLRNMFRNPVWLIVSGFAMALFLRLGSMVSVTAFFAIDVLQQPWAIAVMLSSLSFSLLIGGFIAKPFLTRFGIRNGNIIALLTAIALTGLQAAVMSNIWAFGALFFIANITLGIHSATGFTMISDSVDAQEKRFGSRNEGLLTSTISFAMKVGMAIGGSAIAYGLAIIGYQPATETTASIATPEIQAGIKALYFGLPALFAALQLVIIYFHKEDRS